jgi:hypothetical protein
LALSGGKPMTILENIDEHFPWIILGLTVIAEVVAVYLFTS